ncbi:hypothetical protein GGI07_004098 [Coemansia sp. Benny D115]|nr:hypothetical protein GGI07_004098 [Coemansia sp. Benny D115]
MGGHDGHSVAAAAAAAAASAAAAAAAGTPISNSTHWSTEETRLLIKTWGEHRDEFAEIKRNLSVWNKVLEKLLHAGFFRTVEQCRNRWKFLETKYKAAAKEMDAGGRNTWAEFFDDMHLAKYGPEGSAMRRHPSCSSSSNGSVPAASSKGALDTTISPSQSPQPPHAPTCSSASASTGMGTGTGTASAHQPSLFTDNQGRVQLPPIRQTQAFNQTGSGPNQLHEHVQPPLSSTSSSLHYAPRAQESSPLLLPSSHRHPGEDSGHMRTMSPSRYNDTSSPQHAYLLTQQQQQQQQQPIHYQPVHRLSSRRDSHLHQRHVSGGYQVHPLAEDHLQDALTSSQASSISPASQNGISNGMSATQGFGGGQQHSSESGYYGSNCQHHLQDAVPRSSPQQQRSLRYSSSMGNGPMPASPAHSAGSASQVSALRSGYIQQQHQHQHQRAASIDGTRLMHYGSSSEGTHYTSGSLHARQPTSVSPHSAVLRPKASLYTSSSSTNMAMEAPNPGRQHEGTSPVPRKRKLEHSSDAQHPFANLDISMTAARNSASAAINSSAAAVSDAAAAASASAVLSALAGSVVSEGSTVELVGQIQRVDLLDFLKEQARVREERESARLEERRHAERLRNEEEWRFHEFQMSLISLIKNSLVVPESAQGTPKPATESEMDEAQGDTARPDKAEYEEWLRGKEDVQEKQELEEQQMPRTESPKASETQVDMVGETSKDAAMRSRTSTPVDMRISATSSPSPRVEPTKS